MSGADDLRTWNVLVRVRDLRVRRCRQVLARRKHAANDARTEVARRSAMRERHAASLRELLSRCELGDRDAMPWRQALTLHRLRDEALLADIRAAQRALADALREVAGASAALRRETSARDLARERAREEGSRLREEGE